MRGKFKKASESYFKAIELDPNVFELKGGTGTLLQERSVANRAKYYYFVAQTYAKGQQYDRAILYLRKDLYGETQYHRLVTNSHGMSSNEA